MQTQHNIAPKAVEGSDERCLHLKKMSTKDMDRLARYIDKNVGIQLPASKRTLVEGRLRKRMAKLGLDSFTEYLDFVLDSTDGQDERKLLIDVMTTNKTSFFREDKHFTYLIETALPEREATRKRSGNYHLWSAGCSTGQEAYTLAMVLLEATQNHTGVLFDILATDISSTCLETGSCGIYSEQLIDDIPLALKKKYILKSRNPADKLIQMAPELRKKIHFASCNLMDSSFRIEQEMDFIFCRNVMIYFNNETKEELVRKFEKQLYPGGYLFVGHSESLSGMRTNLTQVAPMVYRKDS